MAGEGVMKIELRDTLSTDISDLPGEIWEDIPGFEDRYQVSNYSRVKSLIKKRPLIISKSISSGKFKVTLVNKFGHISIISCGRLTASVFIRTPKENEVIRYKDNNRLFDIASNLEWITKKESVNSSPNLRTCEKHGMAILKNTDVIEIRSKYHEGVSKRELQQQYNVSLNNIHNIVNRKTWKNI